LLVRSILEKYHGLQGDNSRAFPLPKRTQANPSKRSDSLGITLINSIRFASERFSTPATKYWGSLGTAHILRSTVVPQLSLEESVSALEGETKEQFLNFKRSMFKWLPEKRKQASKLLKDPWMAGAIP
jgi:hypothetical protein